MKANTTPEKDVHPTNQAISNSFDGQSKIIRIARAPWDTGWFQAEVVKQLIEKLGYTVKGPKTMEEAVFYEAATKGEVDLWANGRFPSAQAYLDDEAIRDKVEALGFEVKAGALQGYMIDKRTADSYRIRTLVDLKDRKMARLFDSDGNGKADLIGCNDDWACKQIIDHHIKVYGLGDFVEQVSGDYTQLMAQITGRYHRGKSVLFYTWTPNWTVGYLIPGKDVHWLEVPFTSLPESQKQFEMEMAINDIPGCGSNPCAMGFPANDIRIVANKLFLQSHPELKRLLAVIEIPLEDISNQNAELIFGQDDPHHIHLHARKWIHENSVKVEKWLEIADPSSVLRKGFKLSSKEREGSNENERLRVVTKPIEPFVIYENGKYKGFSIDIWEALAKEIDLDYELYGVNSIAKLLDEVHRGAADLAIAGITISSEREAYLDFSHPYFKSGLQIMIRQSSEHLLGEIFSKVTATVFSKSLLYVIGFLVIILLLISHIIWLAERRSNPDFPKEYVHGIGEAFWWSAVTLTTVGYGDKTPKAKWGRIFAIFWMIAGYFVFAYFTASVTTATTVQQLEGTIEGPKDLVRKRVATVDKSIAKDYFVSRGFDTLSVKTVEEAFTRLEKDELDAIVHDSPVLQYYAAHNGRGKVKVIGHIFQHQDYGIAFPDKSSYRESVNLALLKLYENGVYQKIHSKWFRSENE